MKKITLIILTIIMSFLSTECLFAADAPKALPLLPPKAVPAAQQPELAKQPAAPAAMPAESIYSYNPAGKPDPFRPFVEDEITAKKKEAKKSISSIYPLQKKK
ncbi:MAG: hypothetical protein M0C28_26015 [Candidatus Moduliflexus flocculans]|nr:hypothetical protein [Candidatus Moduliflexus flocculans]